MPKLENPRWERFAQLCALLNNAAEAYRKLGRRKKGQIIKNADVNSAQLMSKPGVRERVAELRRENDRKSEMTRAELLSFYASVIRTPADRVPPGSPVIQSYEVTEHGHKIRIVDKAAAGQALARMCGWNEPEQVNLGLANTLTTYLAELRAQRIGDGMFTVAGETAAPVIELGKSQANGSNHQGQGAEG
jgi:hypothetical protein